MDIQPQIVVKETWFTNPPKYRAANMTVFLSLLLFVTGISYFQNLHGVQPWMEASRDSVFVKGDYWRLWSTLFAHADFGHLINNALLFIPLTFLLYAYFGFWFFPIAGISLGALTNAMVLATMAPHTNLIGISGVVYWMGGAWFTLFLLIDRRRSFRYRFANVLFLMLMLFIPETYWPHVSYLSHFIGFVLGVGSALILYGLKYQKFRQAEVVEYIFEEDDTGVDIEQSIKDSQVE